MRFFFALWRTAGFHDGHSRMKLLLPEIWRVLLIFHALETVSSASGFDTNPEGCHFDSKPAKQDTGHLTRWTANRRD